MTEEFSSKNLELLKQKGAYLYEYMGSFKRFGTEKLPDRECFHSSVKDGTTDNFDVNSISEKSPIGYILEADLGYPIT